MIGYFYYLGMINLLLVPVTLATLYVERKQPWFS